MTVNGYGSILEIDLTTRKIGKSAIPAEWPAKYIGGMGFSSRIIYDEVGPEVEPLSKKNILAFAVGPLTGTQAPCSGRYEVSTKSPLTGIIGTGNSGGMWPARLKHAGIDVLIVRGESAKPVYILIDDDKVEIREAGHLWGKDTKETSDLILQELCATQADFSVLTIGPAGENLVRFAALLNDYGHVAARAGAGAVAGSKKLKAVVVRGTGKVAIANPEAFKEAARKARERVVAAKKARGLPGATPTGLVRHGILGCLQGRNFQTGIVANWPGNKTEDVARKYAVKKDQTCYACPVSCFDLVEVKEGKYAGFTVHRGTMPGVVMDWGAKLDINNLPAIWKCKEQCQKLGLDYPSTSGVIAFATELYQKGILTTKDTHGLKLVWGDDDVFIKLIQDIAFRRDLGDLLAQGSVRAAQQIGHGAEKSVMTIKGMEMMLPDPRCAPRGWMIGSLTNPRGGDNVKNTHGGGDRPNPNWPVENFDMFDEVKREVYRIPPQSLPHTWEGKPTMCKWFEDLYTIANSLVVCFSPAGFTLALGPTYYAEMLSAVTGETITPKALMETGERIFTVLKAYNTRQGLTRKDDTWPERFFEEPMPEGPAKGAMLSHAVIDRVLDEYYALRKWDSRGLPTGQRLTELGLGDIANELVKLGKITRI